MIEISGLDELELPVALVIDNEILAESMGAKVSEIVSAEAFCWEELVIPSPRADSKVAEVMATAKADKPRTARHFWRELDLVANDSLACLLALLTLLVLVFMFPLHFVPHYAYICFDCSTD